MNLRGKIIGLAAGCALLFGAAACVKVDYTLGNDIIPESEKFITRTFSIPIDSIYLKSLDSLSGYSTQRMTVGAIRDIDFGLTRRCSAVSLVPMADSLVFGVDPEFISFHFMVAKDSVSFLPGQEYIIQNFRIYELKEHLDSNYVYSSKIKKGDYDGATPITYGPIVYTGTDSLSFYFTEDFGKKYLSDTTVTLTKDGDLEKYLKTHPGIFVCADDPYSTGGRLNFFKMAADIDSDSRSLLGNYATLTLNAIFRDKNGKLEDKPRDTTYFFSIGATSFDPTRSSFYAFNTTEHDSDSMGKEGLVEGDFRIEGGAGLKPMIEASHIRNLIRRAVKDTVSKEVYGGWDVDELMLQRKLVINKATISLPYAAPADHNYMKYYPQVLNPTMRVSIKNKKKEGTTVTYAGMTDASVSTENQGEVDRSNLCYHPDLSFHIQQILGTNPRTSEGRDSLKREDIWFLILASETITTNNNSSAQSDYYSQLAYANYYSQMLGGYGGYGGYYGGYGGYGGYGYDNYYNYYMYQSLYNSMYNGTSTSTSTTMDKDRYYNAVMRGPKSGRSKGDVPRLTVTYSFLKGRQ